MRVRATMTHDTYCIEDDMVAQRTAAGGCGVGEDEAEDTGVRSTTQSNSESSSMGVGSAVAVTLASVMCVVGTLAATLLRRKKKAFLGEPRSKSGRRGRLTTIEMLETVPQTVAMVTNFMYDGPMAAAASGDDHVAGRSQSHLCRRRCRDVCGPWASARRLRRCQSPGSRALRGDYLLTRVGATCSLMLC